METDAVERRHDEWVEIPAETEAGVPLPLKLRPGAQEGKIRISSVVTEVEADLVHLRQGLTLIEAEQK
jgi:hypothetical protein